MTHFRFRSVPWPTLLVAALAWIVSVRSDPPPDPPLPAPTVDRVGFPTNYTRGFAVLRRVVRKDEGKIVTVYGNPAAASVTNATQLPYPYGSILVMESATIAKTPENQPRLDAHGDPVPGTVTGLHVMRREKDFGSAYATNRTAEWEYVEYRPDGSHLTPPEKSGACAACHVKAGPAKDYVYQARLAAAGK